MDYPEQDLQNEIKRRDALRSTLASPERKKLRESLIELMVQIIAWRDYPTFRRPEWVHEIDLKRSDVQNLLLKHDDLDDEFIQYIWTVCFEQARLLARAKFGTYEGQLIFPLTWLQVFDDDYSLSWLENIRARLFYG